VESITTEEEIPGSPNDTLPVACKYPIDNLKGLEHM
jgi:hypothetical protein